MRGSDYGYLWDVSLTLVPYRHMFLPYPFRGITILIGMVGEEHVVGMPVWETLDMDMGEEITGSKRLPH